MRCFKMAVNMRFWCVQENAVLGGSTTERKTAQSSTHDNNSLLMVALQAKSVFDCADFNRDYDPQLNTHHQQNITSIQPLFPKTFLFKKVLDIGDKHDCNHCTVKR